jgi:hypothetical protein
VFAARVSPGGPTAFPDAPPASDNAPATPNTVTAFVRPLRFEFLRFEFCLPCDMVEASHFTPCPMCNYTSTTAATQRRPPCGARPPSPRAEATHSALSISVPLDAHVVASAYPCWAGDNRAVFALGCKGFATIQTM